MTETLRRVRPVVAVYTRIYLAISMTFVHRQLLGVAGRFSPIALATSTQNTDVFPYGPLFVDSKRFADKVYARLHSYATRRYHFTSPRQTSHWVRLLRSRDARLIHAHFGPHGLDMLPVARRLRIPLIVTFHGFDVSRMLSQKRYVRTLPALFDYAHVLAASRDFHDVLLALGAGSERLEVHYIGIPTDRFAFVERRPAREKAEAGELVRFLQVSNFVEKKGHRYTVEAFSRLASSRPRVELVLAGDGPTRPVIEALARELGVADRVRFTGRVVTEQVRALMDEADVFVHHSVTAANGDKEATTTVIAEAMATGLPVIGTFHGGIPEMITDGVNGFLVEERDVDGYVAKMIAAMESGSELARRAADTIRSRFDLARQNEKLADIYERVIAGL